MISSLPQRRLKRASASKRARRSLTLRMNILAVKSGRMSDCRAGFEDLFGLAGKAQVKAVFDHCVCTDDEKVSVLNMARSCGVDL